VTPPALTRSDAAGAGSTPSLNACGLSRSPDPGQQLRGIGAVGGWCSPPVRRLPPRRSGPVRRRFAGTVPPTAAAVVSGLLLFLSFLPRATWWLAPAAFALLGAVLHGRCARAGFGLGYLAGLGFFLPLLVWTGEFVGALPWLALATLEALFVAVATAGIAVVSRRPPHRCG
ncbi:MAG: hypothetical protein ACRDST_13450, partial [Pseudonocardiaceae bacterium]